jgi:hypothetical protein
MTILDLQGMELEVPGGHSSHSGGCGASVLSLLIC